MVGFHEKEVRSFLYKRAPLCYNKDMKIIHTGDIHIGAAFQGLPQDKSNIRKAEIIDSFRRLCVYAKEERVGAVLIAGDLFDTASITRQTLLETFSCIQSAAPVPFFYVSGNHDGALDIESDAPENLYFFKDGKGYTLHENITVTGLNGEDISSARLQSLALQANAFNVLLLHGDVQKDFSLSDLRGRSVDYLALGHIHKPDIQSLPLDGRGKYRYCGCLEGRGFDEVGERGFFLLDIQKGRLVSERFFSLSTRKVVEVNLDVTGLQTYFQLESEAISLLEKIPPTSIVKINLVGRYFPTLKKDISLLLDRIKERVFFLKIEDKSKLYFNEKEFVNDLTQRGEFVRAAYRYEMNTYTTAHKRR